MIGSSAEGTVAECGAVASAAECTGAAGTFFSRTGFVDDQSASALFGAVQRGDGRVRFRRFRHFDEAESSRTAGLAIQSKTCPRYGSIRFKNVSEFLFRHCVRHVSDVNSHLISFPGFQPFSLFLIPLCADCFYNFRMDRKNCFADRYETLQTGTVSFPHTAEERWIRHWFRSAGRRRRPVRENNSFSMIYCFRHTAYLQTPAAPRPDTQQLYIVYTAKRQIQVFFGKKEFFY